MASFDTVVHYTASLPGATPEEAKKAEAAMRDPRYVKAHNAMTNVLAGLMSEIAGLPPASIVGTIQTVAHHP